MNDKIKDENTEFLFDCILKLETKEDCYSLFDDLCTITEIKAMTQRIVVARMLREGRVYSDIAEATGASTATISRVNRSLNYGSGGYDKVLK